MSSNLGLYIKRYRSNKNLSLRAFANLCNLSYTYISKLEDGIDPRTNKPISPTIDTLQRISSATNADLNYIVELAAYNHISIKCDDALSFGERLKFLRALNGLEGQQLAKILNIAKSTYSGYENNKCEPSYEILISIADYFNVSLDYLLGRAKRCNTDSNYIRIDRDITTLIDKLDTSFTICWNDNPLTDELVHELKGALRYIHIMLDDKFISYYSKPKMDRSV